MPRDKLRLGRSDPSYYGLPYGVDVLYDCPDAAVDICFVHGLTGDRLSTWTAGGQSEPWPKTLLPLKLSRAGSSRTATTHMSFRDRLHR